MKLTKPTLKQIIKESLSNQEIDAILYDLFSTGNGAQAEAIATSLKKNNFFAGIEFVNHDFSGAEMSLMNLSKSNFVFRFLAGYL